MYDALVKFLRAGVHALGAVALFTAADAFLPGPSRSPSSRARRLPQTHRRAVRRDDVGGPPARCRGRFLQRFKRWIGVVILMVVAIVLFAWNYPTTPVVVWTAVITPAAPWRSANSRTSTAPPRPADPDSRGGAAAAHRLGSPGACRRDTLVEEACEPAVP
ncbi:hypothetical protein ABZ848_46120 [Streptomyces sp. NPDC047081]|uniref:hypothetical protein n=1 Tax=Streptomyces sp. NPDC047081 TaxID=3154706 RepID=UPI0034085565